MARREDIPSWSQVFWTVICLTLCHLGISERALAQSADVSQGVSVANSASHSPFLVAPSFAVSGSPSSAAAGDLNGDGRLDLVITRNGSNNVTLLSGTGSGNFAAGADFPAGVQPGSVQIGDINGDGRLDVVVSNRSTGTVNVLLGHGDGTFSKPVEYPAVSDAVSVVMGDFAGNGKLDLAVAGASSRTIAVLLNDGDGHFSKATPYITGKQAQSLAIADLNGDGHTDIISANNDGTLSVLLGGENGLIGTIRSFSVAGSSLSGITAGDFNGDGKVDLAVTRTGSNLLTVLLGRGDGTFQAGVGYMVGNNPVSIVNTDVNADGVPDLITTNEAGNTFSILAGNGDGTFKLSLDFTVGNSPRGIVAGDFNGDGHIDLAILNYLDGTISVPLGNGDGTFQAARAYRADLERKAIAAGDINGDDKADLAVTNFCGNDTACKSNGTVTVFLAENNGAYRSAASYTLGKGPVAVALADFNADGKRDLIALNRTDKSYTVLSGNGDGTFGDPITYSLGKSPLALVVGDFNKDGKPDLAISSDCGLTSCTQPGEVDILLGRGDGGFTASATYPVGYSPLSLAVGDLNGDGIPDLAIANACGEDSACKAHGTATLLAGNGKGGFMQTGEIALGNAPSSVAIDSLSGSGLDLVVTSRTGNLISVLHGDGKGGFKPPTTYAVGSAPSSLVIADFDGDGKKDVAVANFATSNVSVLFGNGDGTLQKASTYSVGTGPESVVAMTPRATAAANLVSANGSSGSSPMGTDITVLANVRAAAAPSVLIATTTTVASSMNPSMVGDSVTFTATVTPNSGTGTPSGKVTFTDASSNPTNLNCNAQMLTGGMATCTTSTLTGGSHAIMATYNGNTTYDTSSGTLTPSQTVKKIDTTTAVKSSLNPSNVNQPVTFTATVTPKTGTGIPSGNVTFVDTSANPTPLNCSSQMLTGGMATCTTSALTGGTHAIMATYNSDSTYNTSNGILTPPQTVNPVASITTVVSSSPSNTSTVDDSVTFTATISPANGAVKLSGKVSFTDNGNPIGDCNAIIVDPATGKAMCPDAALTAGNHSVVATYNSDNSDKSYLTSNSSVLQKVSPAATTTVVQSSSTNNASTVNDLVTFTATVTPFNGGVKPSGNVAFTDNGNPISNCTAIKMMPSNGQAACPTKTLTAGSHTIKAIYNSDNSDPNFKESLPGTLTPPQTVAMANSTIAIASSANPSTVGQPVTFTATVTPFNGGVALSGNVAFTNSGNPISNCPPVKVNPANGQATCAPALSFFTAGTSYAISATYNSDNSDTNFKPSGPTNLNPPQTVGRGSAINITATSSSTNNTSNVNEPVTFTAKVTLSNGSLPPPGSVPLSSNATVTFMDGTIAITCNPSPMPWDPATGIATCSTAFLNAKDSPHKITATYANDPNYGGNTSSVVSQTVMKTTPAVALAPTSGTSTVNQSVTFTATVTANPAGPILPTGSVTFTTMLNGQSKAIPGCEASSVSQTGTATCTYSALLAGVNTVTAVYGGDLNFNQSIPSNSSVQTVNKATPTVVVSSPSATSVVNQSVTFTATVTPTNSPVRLSGGTVIFMDGTTPIVCGESTPLDPTAGVATCSTALLDAAHSPHSITAMYAGDPNYSSTTSAPAMQIVQPAPSAIVLGQSAGVSASGQAVTYTATVMPFTDSVKLSGSVTFTDNGSAIANCTIPINPSNGQVTCTTSSVTAGSSAHTITASYSSDPNYSMSAAVPINIAPIVTLISGQTANNTATVNFTGLPAGTALRLLCDQGFISPNVETVVALAQIPIGCIPSPTSLGSGDTTVTVTINTNVPRSTSALDSHADIFAASPLGLPAIALLPLLRRRKHPWRTFAKLLGVLVLAVLALQGIACGGHFTPPPTVTGGTTPPGVYYLRVDAVNSADTPIYEAVVPVTVGR
jgi:hypothetical protein